MRRLLGTCTGFSDPNADRIGASWECRGTADSVQNDALLVGIRRMKRKYGTSSSSQITGRADDHGPVARSLRLTNSFSSGSRFASPSLSLPSGATNAETSSGFCQRVDSALR